MKRVLVLTNRKALGKVVEEKLTPHGYEVIVMEKSVEANPVVKEKKVDFVLFDVELALEEGPKALDTTREINPDVPVVVTSLIREREST
ncbi:MAG: response regulator [Candidatus Eremiobacteraeota bacterium]|nr:response regulator [Candidatus Eremiobacteraeota bacterium]